MPRRFLLKKSEVSQLQQEMSDRKITGQRNNRMLSVTSPVRAEGKEE
jgi:hypothetical protein